MITYNNKSNQKPPTIGQLAFLTAALGKLFNGRLKERANTIYFSAKEVVEIVGKQGSEDMETFINELCYMWIEYFNSKRKSRQGKGFWIFKHIAFANVNDNQALSISFSDRAIWYFRDTAKDYYKFIISINNDKECV